MASSYAPPVQTLGEREGSPKTTRGGWRMPSFFGGKSHGAFGQPAFFLAGNCMTTIAFEKEFFFKSLPCGTKFLREFHFGDWRFFVFCGN